MASANFTIGELSRATGVNIETIRYYERVDLLPEPPRSRGGHRLYEEEHVKRLQLIARSRELGFPLSEIRALLVLGDRDALTCDEMLKHTRQHLSSIRAKINDLQRLEALLQSVSRECRGGDTPECPILDALYRTDTPSSNRQDP